jgi:hypothetical protein
MYLILRASCLITIIALFCFAQEESIKKDIANDEEFQIAQKEYLRKLEIRKSEYNDTLKKVLIPGPDTATLVALIASQTPLLSTGTYNNNLKQVYSSKWADYLELRGNEKPVIDIQLFRKNMLFAISEEAYINYKWTIAKDERVFNDSMKNVLIRGKKIRGDTASDSVLHAKYDSYYNYLFVPQNESIFNLIAATDSIFLDSILKEITIQRSAGNDDETGENHSLFKKNFFSDTYRYDSLPEDLQRVADSVETNRWSKIKKYRWGYITLGLNLQKIRRGISFEDAYPQLLYLPNMADLPVMLTEDRMMNFFKENKKLFQKDTLFLSIKIFPSIYHKIDGKFLSAIMPHGTISEIKCADYELPFVIRQEVINTIELPKNESTDWLDLKYGKWKIRCIARRKGKTVDFAECKDSIIQYLKPAWIQRQANRANAIITTKKEEKSKRFFKDYFYLAARYSNGKPNAETIGEIKAWTLQNLWVKLE